MTIREFFEEAEKIAGVGHYPQRVYVQVSRPDTQSQPRFEYYCNAPQEKSIGGTEIHTNPENALQELREIVSKRVETEMEISPS